MKTFFKKINKSEFFKQINSHVKASLKEDIGSGDLSSILIKNNITGEATIFSKEKAVFCGKPWVDEIIKIYNKYCSIIWFVEDGDLIKPGQIICKINGKYSVLLSIERTCLNYIQLLSGTSTFTKKICDIVNVNGLIFDTRKTIPGLRIAQKYAVKIGGGNNQRHGLYDEILIKENHIKANNSLEELLKKLKNKKLIKKIQVEIENNEQLQICLDFGIKNILLDNFSIQRIKEAVKINKGRGTLEISGNINEKNIKKISKLGVDRISVGALTKNIKSIDFSMLIQQVKPQNT
jgi:nicotinate-nucleotide pyrophosphorylase (carboxylating)